MCAEKRGTEEANDFQSGNIDIRWTHIFMECMGGGGRRVIKIGRTHGGDGGGRVERIVKISRTRSRGRAFFT